MSGSRAVRGRQADRWPRFADGQVFLVLAGAIGGPVRVPPARYSSAS
jgi:hypothetical protein